MAATMYMVMVNGEHKADLDATEGFDGDVAIDVAVMVKAIGKRKAAAASVIPWGNGTHKWTIVSGGLSDAVIVEFIPA